jgi:5-aminopentanamidase
MRGADSPTKPGRTVIKAVVAAVQAEDVQNDVEATLFVVRAQAERAAGRGAEIVVFPECYLQGYVFDEAETVARAIDLESGRFREILRELASLEPTLIIGLIESSGGRVFNTAAVIKAGRLVGSYRKRHIHAKEIVFESGKLSPVFALGGTHYGINICYDARFDEPAAELAQQGASILFYPLNNRLPHETAKRWRERHVEYLQERARQTGAFVVSADVVMKSAVDTGYGCTAVISPSGDVLVQAPYSAPALLVQEVGSSAAPFA